MEIYDNLLSCLYRFGKVAGMMVFWLIECQATEFMADMSKEFITRPSILKKTALDSKCGNISNFPLLKST